MATIAIDPVSRVAGPLALHGEVDAAGNFSGARASTSIFRGYEIILRDRDVRDAIFISSRACGVCGGVHATCSALAIEQAFGIAPPPMGVVARNLLLAVEYLYDHPIHLGLLAGPDFSEPAMRDTNPEIWEKALSTRTRNRGIHGYEFMSELMTDLTPLTGKLYLEALHYTRVAREAYVLIRPSFRVASARRSTPLT
jgi:hydrogenase large subunit